MFKNKQPKIDLNDYYGKVATFQTENMFEEKSLIEELEYENPNSSYAFDLSVKVDGLKRCNKWLGSSIAEKFESRLDNFQKIMDDRRMKIIEKNMGIACFTKLYLEYGEEFMGQFINCMEKYNISMDQDLYSVQEVYFKRALSQLRYFLNDSSYDEFENKSQYVFCDCNEDWDAVDYYKMLLANHECLDLLGSFKEGLKTREKPKNTKR